MLRYFNGQYAQNLNKGGMLGYVMDGQVDDAIKNVSKAIKKHSSKLHLSSKAPLTPSPALSSTQVKQSSHNYGPDKIFTIYHIFLPLS